MEEVIEKSIECPSCKVTITYNPNYAEWCQECEWNLKFEDKIKSKSKFEEFYLKISKIQSKYLFEKVINEDLFNLKISKLRIIAYIASFFIIILNFSFLIIGIYLLFLNWGGISNYLLSFVFLAIFWLSKPSLRKIPKDDFLSKDNFPELYNLVNQVCNELKTTNVEGIILNEDFNASISEYGFSRKKVLRIGLPLWNVLNEEEKLDLLGHEISHCTNKDPSRRIVIGTAIDILIDTGHAIYPDKLLSNDISSDTWGYIPMELGKYVAIPINLLLRLISHILYFFARSLCQMIWVDSQRAEYLADLNATKIMGKKSAISGMEKSFLYEIIDFELSKLALKNNKELENIDFFTILNDKVSNLPFHETERLKRLSKFENHRLDATHPPTIYRIKMLEKKGFETGNFNKEKVDFEKIKEEISKIEHNIKYKLIDIYKSRLFIRYSY
ncbi:MAG: M48 family metallopeptidase [Cyanobacteriota bacterium]